MQLKTLCQNLINLTFAHDIEITGLTLDSRQVKPGNLFLACAGTHANGGAFIDQAIKQGAVAVFCETASTIKPANTPILVVPQLSSLVGPLAARFYEEPSKTLSMYGVTGTNGKTSVTHYLAQALNALNEKCVVLGTVGNGFLDQLEKSTHTTPDPIALQKMLAFYAKEGAQAVAMEVSSHGLEQGRVNGVDFDTAIFTNLTRDHLDYHHTMENYAAAKRKLFTMPTLKQAIFNLDDPFGKKLIEEFKFHLPCYSYSINSNNCCESVVPLIHASEIQYTAKGMKAKISTPWGEGILESGLFGAFNLSNLLALITFLGTKNVALEKIFYLISTIKPVKGRMELLQQPDKPSVVIDYAHTPDALQKVLSAIRDHSYANLWCVFGCGGDRDEGKRGEMGKIAEELAEHVIVTNDNPRHETPEKISAQIFAGMMYPEKAKMLLDRKEAIHYALSQANKNDMVVIAGKGHENYQQIGDDYLPFSDQETVKNYFSKN